MKWKMVGPRKDSSPRKAALKVLRLVRGSTNEGPCLSSTGAHQDQRCSETFNTEAYIISNQRMHELETQKAFVTSLSRHERWKAGGPL